jgi:hypothetical protein
LHSTLQARRSTDWQHSDQDQIQESKNPSWKREAELAQALDVGSAGRMNTH